MAKNIYFHCHCHFQQSIHALIEANVKQIVFNTFSFVCAHDSTTCPQSINRAKQ